MAGEQLNRLTKVFKLRLKIKGIKDSGFFFASH